MNTDFYTQVRIFEHAYIHFIPLNIHILYQNTSSLPYTRTKPQTTIYKSTSVHTYMYLDEDREVMIR